jgi:hypothetical protein
MLEQLAQQQKLDIVQQIKLEMVQETGIHPLTINHVLKIENPTTQNHVLNEEQL